MNLEELLKSEDLSQLKAAAYDQIVANEQGARVLAALNQRISELSATPEGAEDSAS